MVYNGEILILMKNFYGCKERNCNAAKRKTDY